MYTVGDVYKYVNGSFVQKPEHKINIAKVHQAVYQKKVNAIIARTKRAQKAIDQAEANASVIRMAKQNIAEGKIVKCMV